MKIKFIKPPAPLGLAYFNGDEAEFENKQAESLIESGYAVEIKKFTATKEAVTQEAAKD